MERFPNSLRILLLILTVVAIIPQVSRILSRRDCEVLVPNYVLFNLIVATEHFAFYLFYILHHQQGGPVLVRSPPSAADYLDLAQFAIATLYHLLIFALYLYFPPGRRAAKAYMVSTYLAFLLASFVPIFFDLPGKQSREGIGRPYNGWFAAVYSTLHAYVVHPIVTGLAIASLAPQMRALRASSSPPGALSIPGLGLQALTWALLAGCWVMRLPLPEGFVYPEWQWYGLVGWAAVDDMVFAVVQGTLWWIATGGGRLGDARPGGEAQPLLG